MRSALPGAFWRVCASVITLTTWGWSADYSVDEDALFGDPDALVIDSAMVGDDVRALQGANESTGPQKDGGTLHWGGDISSVLSVNWSRSDLRTGAEPTTTFSAIGVLHADARLPDNHKGYLALELQQDAQADTAQLAVRELFVDVHFSHKLYLRTGKQVLQWGRGWFWNPSDLINVERKALVDRVGAREGAYGLRAHVPVGTDLNFYTFLDARDARTTGDWAGAFKTEFLMGRTETGVGIWGRPGQTPVGALDFSTRILQWSLVGEGVWIPPGLFQKMERRGDTLALATSTEGAPRFSLGLGRSFTVLGVSERLQVHYEYFYNGTGTRGNPWESEENLVFADPVSVVRQGSPLLFILGHGLYEPYHFARHYAAAFYALRNFVVQDLTLSTSGMLNMEDRSYALTGALGYSTLNNLDAEVSVMSLGGQSPGEFTFSGQRLWVRTRLGLRF